MKICACNNCENIWEDTNPQSGTPEYPDVLSIGVLKDGIDNEGYGKWCPECTTDAYLTDDIEHIASKWKNRSIIQNAIEYCGTREEYQEEDSTGWSQLQNLIQLIKH